VIASIVSRRPMIATVRHRVVVADRPADATADVSSAVVVVDAAKQADHDRAGRDGREISVSRRARSMTCDQAIVGMRVQRSGRLRFRLAVSDVRGTVVTDRGETARPRRSGLKVDRGTERDLIGPFLGATRKSVRSVSDYGGLKLRK